MEIYAYPLLLLGFAVLFTREVVAPASQNHCDKRWLILASVCGGATVLVTIGVGLMFQARIQAHALLPVPEHWPAPLVGLLSFLITSFVFYWWHRATHRFDFLWRHVHQLHHSAPRIEALTAFFAHPLDTAAAAVMGSAISYGLLGGSAYAAAWALGLTGAFDLYLHADRHSPRWLGYLIQRPEMHRIHHAWGHHADNYGLPIWDILFGTFRNPEHAMPRVGFDADKSARITDMLLGRDVHAQPH